MEATMTDNATTNRSVLERVWGGGEVDLLDEVTSPGYRFHDPTQPEPLGVEDEKRLVTDFRAAFPDLRFTIEDEVADGDAVAQRWTARGTHRGEFMGLAPTGREFAVAGNSFVRFRDGKLAEVWTTWDALGLLRSVGAIPA
jgi:steroid delta-isomerase-like uncharacterized protein